jgi:hypothetical protein
VLDGKRYSHIVDPKTGLGLTDQSNVTVIGPDGMTTDALSTAVSVLGPEKGLKLVEETPGTAAYIVRLADGKIEVRQSSRWKDLPVVNKSVYHGGTENTEQLKTHPPWPSCLRCDLLLVGTCTNPHKPVK